MSPTHLHAAPLPTLFTPHGGGPWPIMPLGPMPHQETSSLAGFMKSIAALPPSPPRFLVVISAHWETHHVTVHAGATPPLLFDYYNMPPKAYELTWPAVGAPERAEEALELLRAAGFDAEREVARGFDHGVFVPLLLAYPRAEVPVVQVSLRRGLDPAEHMAIGEALAPLRARGGYVIGSGSSYHNLRQFFQGGERERAQALEFDAWLNEAVCAPPAERAARLARWAEAPHARACHPREEHLLPLMVASGAAAKEQGRVAWEGTMAGLKLSAHLFG